MSRGRPAFSGAGRLHDDGRSEAHGARLSVSPVAVQAKQTCQARKVDGTACHAFQAKGTPYCIGHGRSLGVIVLGDPQ